MASKETEASLRKKANYSQQLEDEECTFKPKVDPISASICTQSLNNSVFFRSLMKSSPEGSPKAFQSARKPNPSKRHDELYNQGLFSKQIRQQKHEEKL